MKKIQLLILLLGIALINMSACSSGDDEFREDQTNENQQNEESEMEGNNIMNIKVGNTVLAATLVDNSSTAALKEMLKDSPLTIEMHDYGDMEKVGPIGANLPRNDEQITTVPGDLILYQGNSLVIYYDTNSWNFTRLGKINDVTQEELKETLGNGDVTVTLELAGTDQ